MHILLTAMSESPGTFWEQFTGHFQTALENSGVFLADALWALIKVAAIFLAARFALAVVSRMTRHVMNSARYHRTESGGKRTDTVMTLTRSFSRYLIYSVALVMALVELGVGDLVNNLIVTAGIGSVAIGFGAQSLVKDMVTGFFLMFENQFSVGDYIKVDGQEGYVEATAMRVTYLRTFKGEQIIIPNGNISQVINYTRGGYTAVVSVKVPFTMDADTVLEAVRLAAERACAGNPDVIEPPKLRGVTAFDQYGYEVTAAAKVKALTQWGCEWPSAGRSSGNLPSGDWRSPPSREGRPPDRQKSGRAKPPQNRPQKHRRRIKQQEHRSDQRGFLLFFVWFKGWLFAVLSGPDGLPDGIGIVGEDEHIILDGEELPIGTGASEIVGGDKHHPDPAVRLHGHLDLRQLEAVSGRSSLRQGQILRGRHRQTVRQFFAVLPEFRPHGGGMDLLGHHIRQLWLVRHSAGDAAPVAQGAGRAGNAVLEDQAGTGDSGGQVVELYRAGNQSTSWEVSVPSGARRVR